MLTVGLVPPPLFMAGHTSVYSGREVNTYIVLTQPRVGRFLYGQEILEGCLIVVVEFVGQHDVCRQISVDEMDGKPDFGLRHVVGGDVWHLKRHVNDVK